MTTRKEAPADDAELIELCRARAVALLERNLSAHGILAATPGARAHARGYSAVFARDAAVCALGMALSGCGRLEQEAARGLLTLAAHQAANGQIAKFVDMSSREADFWYLGCIDATLWWLLAVDFLDRRAAHRGLRARLQDNVQRRVFIETSALLGMLLLAILFAWLVARSMARSLRELRPEG